MMYIAVPATVTQRDIQDRSSRDDGQIESHWRSHILLWASRRRSSIVQALKIYGPNLTPGGVLDISDSRDAALT